MPNTNNSISQSCYQPKSPKCKPTYDLQHVLVNMQNFLTGLLVSIPTKNSILIYCLAWKRYTIMHIWYLAPMNKLLKRNSNTWLTECLQVGFVLFHYCQRGWPSQTNFSPSLSQQMHQAQTTLTAGYLQYCSTDFGIKVFTTLDVSIQYFTVELDKETQELCAIITPFVKQI